MEYLYSQSGKSLTVMNNPEEEDRLVEQTDDEVQDEGFVEEEPEDLTVPILYDPSEAAPVHSSSPQASRLSPSASGPSTSSQGLFPLQWPAQPSHQPPLQPPKQHPAQSPESPHQRPAQPPQHPPLQPPPESLLQPSIRLSADSGPATSAGSAVAHQADVSRLLMIIICFSICDSIIIIYLTFIFAGSSSWA